MKKARQEGGLFQQGRSHFFEPSKQKAWGRNALESRLVEKCAWTECVWTECVWTECVFQKAC
jgi:hypothetical protein